MSNPKKVLEILQRYDELEQWNDLQDFGDTDLMSSEGIGEEDAILLYHNIQWVLCDQTDLFVQHPKVTAETIAEAIHQGLDGWTDEEKVVIVAFLHDLRNAVKHLIPK